MSSVTESRKKNEWVEWIKAFFIALIIVIIIKVFVISTSVVEGESMEPTLADGDKLIFNKFIYLIGEPDRGDVVIIQTSLKNYVKRIIALPGEVVEVIDHTLYINNKEVEQAYISEEAIKGTGDFGPTEVPNDSYFVMGDNRVISMDSRHPGFGFIDKDNIIGRSELIFHPFSEWAITR